MTLKLLICAVMALGLAACGKDSGGGRAKSRVTPVITDQDPVEPQPLPPVRQEGFVATLKRRVEIAPDLSNLDEFILGMNQFEWQVEAFDGRAHEREASCKKIKNSDANRRTVVGRFDRSGAASVLVEVQENDPAVNEVECVVSDRGQVLARFTYKLRKSFVVHGEMAARSLSLGEKLGNLVLLPSSILTTHGDRVTLRFEKIIAANAKLRTLAEVMFQATAERPGITPGEILLEADEGYGELEVELRGQNGGDAITSRAPVTAVPARTADLNGACRGYHSRGDQRCFGKKGHRGYPGENGVDGAPGGDSGALKFTAADARHLRLKLRKIPGVGGRGLPGSVGGAGGPGGIGSTIVWHTSSPRGCPHCFGQAGDLLALNPTEIEIHEYKFPDGPPR